jgi:hypothetical protein
MAEADLRVILARKPRDTSTTAAVLRNFFRFFITPFLLHPVRREETAAFNREPQARRPGRRACSTAATIEAHSRRVSIRDMPHHYCAKRRGNMTQIDEVYSLKGSCSETTGLR